jgi:hypothetical protein
VKVVSTDNSVANRDVDGIKSHSVVRKEGITNIALLTPPFLRATRAMTGSEVIADAGYEAASAVQSCIPSNPSAKPGRPPERVPRATSWKSQSQSSSDRCIILESSHSVHDPRHKRARKNTRLVVRPTPRFIDETIIFAKYSTLRRRVPRM